MQQWRWNSRVLPRIFEGVSSLFQLRSPVRIAPLVSILALASYAATASPHSCVSSPADQTQVTETMRTMYAAATADDLAKFHSVAAPDFYAFDNGKRYDGDALMNAVKEFHDKGVVFVWTVTDPHVETTCNFAWITYTNRGSMRGASGTQDVSWLESAVLQKQAGTWRIRFFHSTRVPQ
jgi:ketosteroid isomerase-like protein